MDNTTPLATTNDAATPLPELAELITQAHRAADGSAREAVQHAITAGRLLLDAKGRLPHGDFQPWLKQNCGFNERTAQRYMHVARVWDSLDDKKRHDVSQLALRRFLKSFPSQPRPRGSAKAPSGATLPTDYACPWGCGFEWQGINPKPPTQSHPLATLIALVRRLRPKHVEQVHAFVQSLTAQSETLEKEAA
jgi:Protein of unknown function (DUF3102)